MFDALMSFDRPFNQAPSLHVALTAVLWVAYGRHFRSIMLRLGRVWFVVMALSTLTTYQHHFIDLPTGLWVGLFATTLFPENPPKAYAPSRDPQRFRLSVAYFIGGLGFVAAAYFVGGAVWLLLWPAGALVIVGLIYLTGRAELFRKSEGGIPAAPIMLLAPYVLGAWLNSRWHTRREPIAQEIASGVWLGRIPGRAERDVLGIASIVDLTAELPIERNGIAYRGVPMLDLLTPTVDQIDAAVRAIAELEPHRPTLVCCALGYSRSAAAVAAWLVAIGKVESIDSAIQVIRAKRPSIVVPERSALLLARWAGMRAMR
jgi:protein-tyrosine phosphatase